MWGERMLCDVVVWCVVRCGVVWGERGCCVMWCVVRCGVG